MRNFLCGFIVAVSFSSAFAEVNSPQVATAISTPFVTSYTITRSRAAELGSLGRLYDGYKMNAIRGDVGEAIVDRAIFGGHDLASSSKGTWVSVSPRYGRQGIDLVRLRVNKNGLPNDMIVDEVKYGSSQLGRTKDGVQMGASWRNVRLSKIGERYMSLANSAQPIVRAKDVPIGAGKRLDVYFSKTHKVTFWKENGRWYTDAKESLTDAQLRTRVKTYGKYFSSAGAGILKTRNFLSRVQEKANGDYLVTMNKLTHEGKVSSSYEVVVRREFIEKGRVDLRVLEEALKKKHPSWSDARIVREARNVGRVVSNKELVNAQNARDEALKEIRNSSLASAGIAGALSFVFQLGAEAYEHGADLKSYDYTAISIATVKGAAVAGVSSYVGQRTALWLTSSCGFSSSMAKMIGGSASGLIIAAGSYGDCLLGNKSWKEGSVEAGIGAASMLAGHYAAAGVSSWLAGSAAAAGTATAASAGAAGTTAAAGTAGAASAGAVGGGGFLVAAAPFAAAVVVGAVVAWAGYELYNHREGKKLMVGDINVHEKMLDAFMADSGRLDQSVNRLLGASL